MKPNNVSDRLIACDGLWINLIDLTSLNLSKC